ncbi:MAG: DNA-binding protein [Bacteroidota bacterium]
MPASPPSRYVRKQISVTPEQDRALKRRSRELGVSEAELVRRALDAALSEDPITPPAGSPLDELLAHTRDLGEGRRLDGGWNRDALYDDRGYRRSRGGGAEAK